MLLLSNDEYWESAPKRESLPAGFAETSPIVTFLTKVARFFIIFAVKNWYARVLVCAC